MLGQSMVEIKRKPCHVGASGDCPKKDVIDPHNYLRLGNAFMQFITGIIYLRFSAVLCFEEHIFRCLQ